MSYPIQPPPAFILKYGPSMSYQIPYQKLHQDGRPTRFSNHSLSNTNLARQCLFKFAPINCARMTDRPSSGTTSFETKLQPANCPSNSSPEFAPRWPIHPINSMLCVNLDVRVHIHNNLCINKLLNCNVIMSVMIMWIRCIH